MMVPHSTLWTKSLHVPLRLSVRAFTERNVVDKQARDIQSLSLRTIEITPGALYLLSSVVGRRMTESARWILFESLQEILNGDLRTLYPEKQDLLAATFGELLGVMLLAFQLDGTVEVIRLLESQYGKMPDYLLLQTTPSGPTAHILECKGSVEDVRNINHRRGEIDICGEQRDRFREAQKQIAQMQLNNISMGASVKMHQALSFTVAQQASSENVVVSAVPDGRMKRLCDPQVQFTSRWQCHTVTCKECMTPPNHFAFTSAPVSANIISVLYRKQGTQKAMQEQLLNFLAHYRAAQRSIWAGNDFFFNREWQAIIKRLVRREGLQAFLPSLLFMTITLVEAALGEDLINFDFQIGPLSAIAPEELQDILTAVDAQFRRVRELSTGAVSQDDAGFDPGDAPGMPDNMAPREFPLRRDETSLSADRFWESWEAAHKAAHDQVPFEPGGEDLRWFEGDSSVLKAVGDFIRTGTSAKMLLGTLLLNDYNCGTARRIDEGTTIIRLVSLTREYSALKTYVEGLIARLRFSKVPALDWAKEYVREQQQAPFVIGESWDTYPYPDTHNSGAPGITAWLSEDGRAQIIVRKRV